MERKERSKGTGSLFQRTAGGPWIAAYMNWTGKRVIKSTKTTDKAAAARILAKYVADAALRREGVVDPRLDSYALHARRPLEDHITEYAAHCRLIGQNDHHLYQKQFHLRQLVEETGISRLADLTADILERRLGMLKEAKRSARTLNFARQIAVAFMQWCVRTGRAQTNPLRVVPKQDESRDRRRVRRPLSEAELARLVAVGRERGRHVWYLAAVLAGLRKGDLERLVWSDISFADGTITISGGKAQRTDVLPLHPQLAQALRERHAQTRPLPTDRVFPETVRDLTRQKDLLRAGIARREPVLGRDGQPIMIGIGKWRRQKTRITTADELGRVVDLHALRSTLATQLARAGVAPQVAQKIMRHSDYRTTLKHYTVLGLADSADALTRIPGVAVGPTGPATIAPSAPSGSSPTPANQAARPAHAATNAPKDATGRVPNLGAGHPARNAG